MNIKLELLPKLFQIIAKLDLKPLVNKLKELDLGDLKEGKLAEEQYLVLFTEVITELLPQFDKIANDIIPFFAIYNGISEEEAKKLDAGEEISKLINDGAFVNFFKSALRKRVEQTH